MLLYALCPMLSRFAACGILVLSGVEVYAALRLAGQSRIFTQSSTWQTHEIYHPSPGDLPLLPVFPDATKAAASPTGTGPVY